MFAVGCFWALLAFTFLATVVVGLGRHGWREVRHEMRKRKSL